MFAGKIKSWSAIGFCFSALSDEFNSARLQLGAPVAGVALIGVWSPLSPALIENHSSLLLLLVNVRCEGTVTQHHTDKVCLYYTSLTLLGQTKELRELSPKHKTTNMPHKSVLMFLLFLHQSQCLFLQVSKCSIASQTGTYECRKERSISFLCGKLHGNDALIVSSIKGFPGKPESLNKLAGLTNVKSWVNMQLKQTANLLTWIEILLWDSWQFLSLVLRCAGSVQERRWQTTQTPEHSEGKSISMKMMRIKKNKILICDPPRFICCSLIVLILVMLQAVVSEQTRGKGW